ncbi:hypothetical protein [uncultured Litoreibacter sp.]|uniref:hypothetical protein n=1 Tax=uncultured Litoreibacter sp. TaxID=1392394 RepID=UPI0026036CFC|nr:hypothetical protein [uncultured Litoreibacter sp.]
MTSDLAYLRWAILRQLPIGLATATLVLALTVAALTVLPARYTATARLLVEASSVSANARAVADTQTDAAHLQNIENRLMTQSRLARLTRDLSLTISAEELREAALFEVISGRGKATTLTISVTNADADLATVATNGLADEVLKENRIIRTERAEDALGFFRQEVTNRKLRLDVQFEKLLAFKDAHAGSLPEDAARHIDRRKDLLAQQTAVPTRPAMTPDQRRLMSEISAARSVYSDQHPKVKLLVARLGSVATGQALSTAENPLIADALSRVDAQLAAIPSNGLALKALTRDHDLAENQYKQAVSRLEAAAIEERIALRTNGDRLSIVERAALPDSPTGPRQKVLLAGGIGLAFLLAIAAAVLRARGDPHLRRSRDLEVGLGLRPYAVIPNMQTTSTGN